MLNESFVGAAPPSRAAYRRLAKQSHPDLHPGDKKAEERFKQISAAHDLLSDPEKATRAAVLAEMRKAARLLAAGDLYFLSFSGHGGQVLHKALHDGLARNGQQGLGGGVGVRTHPLAHARHGDDDLHSSWFSLSRSRYVRSRPLLVQWREGPHFP